MKRDNTIEIIKELKKLGIITIAKRKSKSRRKYNAKFYRSKQVPPQLPPPYVRGVQTFTQTPQKHMMDEQAQLNLELGKKALMQPMIENRTITPFPSAPQLTIKPHNETTPIQIEPENDDKYTALSNTLKSIDATQQGMISVFDTKINPMLKQFASQNNNPKIVTSASRNRINPINSYVGDERAKLINEYKALGGATNNIRVKDSESIRELIDLLKESQSRGIPIHEVNNTTSAKAIRKKLASMQASEPEPEPVEEVLEPEPEPVTEVVEEIPIMKESKSLTRKTALKKMLDIVGKTYELGDRRRWTFEDALSHLEEHEIPDDVKELIKNTKK